MTSSQLLIEIAPARLSVARQTGKGLQPVAMRELTLEDWNQMWLAGSNALGTQLSSLIDEASCRGASATVYYQSPTVACGLFSCPQQVRDFSTAARLALTDLAGFDLAENAWAIQPLLRDRSGEAKRRHIVLAADKEPVIKTISSATAQAGLRSPRIVPMESALLAWSVDRSISNSAGAQPIVFVHFGQSRSLIVAACNRRLLLARQVDFGTDRLLEALAGTLAGAADKPDTRLARNVLFEHGLPKYGETLTIADQQLRAADILPAIQPVLQRMLVEIRQSVRFGLAETSSEQPLVFLSGSGASIQGLSSAFAAELSLECISDSPPPHPASADLHHARSASRLGLRIQLRPHSEIVARSVRSTRHALYAGTAAALALGAAHTAVVMQQTRELEPKLDAATSMAPASIELPADPRQAATETNAVRSTISAIDRTLGSAADLGSVLRELCTIPAHIAILTDIDFTGSGESAECKIRGYVIRRADESELSVRPLIDQLRASPLIESVRLEGTQSSTLDSREALHFSATLRLQTFPFPILPNPAMVASAAELVP